MKIHFTKSFKKSYKNRIKPNKTLAKRFKQRFDIFEVDPSNPILRDHPLGGKMQGFRSFSVTGDIRVIYHIHKGTIFLVDIGTHNQVYGK